MDAGLVKVPAREIPSHCAAVAFLLIRPNRFWCEPLTPVKVEPC